MQGKYLDTSVSIDNEDQLILKQGESSLVLGKFNVENCGTAIHLGRIPTIKKYNKLSLALAIAQNNRSRVLLDLRNKLTGWILGEEIFNLDYELVGFLRDNKVSNIVNEFIGCLIGSYIAHGDSCYENGEPIYISSENREFKQRNPEVGYDVSFRLF